MPRSPLMRPARAASVPSQVSPAEMLARRTLSAAVGIPILVALVIVGGRAFGIALALILAAATAEVLFQAGVPVSDPLLWIATLMAAALPSALIAAPVSVAPMVAVFLALSLLAAVKSTPGANFDRWSLVVAVTFYVGWLGSYFGLLRFGNNGRDWVLVLLFVTFASDTGAYAVGRLFGRHKLAPQISPAKTIEGAFGGLIASAAVAVLAGALLRLHGSPWRMLALGLAVSVAAQLGDLAESALKRRLEIKDAGSLVPGHGGLLDRLDSLLFTGAVVYYAVRWISL
jgi:phosphatidate cytidylyltransferase